jgi:hypothetical protein
MAQTRVYFVQNCSIALARTRIVFTSVVCFPDVMESAQVVLQQIGKVGAMVHFVARVFAFPKAKEKNSRTTSKFCKNWPIKKRTKLWTAPLNVGNN